MSRNRVIIPGNRVDRAVSPGGAHVITKKFQINLIKNDSVFISAFNGLTITLMYSVNSK